MEFELDFQCRFGRFYPIWNSSTVSNGSQNSLNLQWEFIKSSIPGNTVLSPVNLKQNFYLVFIKNQIPEQSISQTPMKIEIPAALNGTWAGVIFREISYCIHWRFPVNLFPLAQRALSPMELESTRYIHYALIFEHMFENRKKRHTDRIVRVSQWESNTKLCTNCQINNMTICTFCSAKSPQSSQCRFTYDLQLFYLRFHVVFHLYEIFRGKLYYEAWREGKGETSFTFHDGCVWYCSIHGWFISNHKTQVLGSCVKRIE